MNALPELWNDERTCVMRARPGVASGHLEPPAPATPAWTGGEARRKG